MSDDLKQEDSDNDSSLEEFIKQKKIKNEPEVLITTPEAYNIDYPNPVERKKGLHKLNKKSKNPRKNGISKKLKKQKLARYSEDIMDCAESLFEPKDDCDDKFKSSVPYSCTLCERKFTKKPALDLHLKRHEDQMKKIYTCGQCKRYGNLFEQYSRFILFSVVYCSLKYNREFQFLFVYFFLQRVSKKRPFG